MSQNLYHTYTYAELKWKYFNEKILFKKEVHEPFLILLKVIISKSKRGNFI